MIAFLGLGLLGGNFVRAALRRGEQVQVWNRTPDKARALAPLGALVCEQPEDAVRGATRVHLVLSDDAAVDEVLERARPGLAAGAQIIDHTTTSPAGTRARVERLQAEGFSFLHA
ncbi:MAG TPA: NAD(P)-binding domain-containing protein, partial [Polyangiales bacterium]